MAATPCRDSRGCRQSSASGPRRPNVAQPTTRQGDDGQARPRMTARPTPRPPRRCGAAHGTEPGGKSKALSCERQQRRGDVERVSKGRKIAGKSHKRILAPTSVNRLLQSVSPSRVPLARGPRCERYVTVLHCLRPIAYTATCGRAMPSVSTQLALWQQAEAHTKAKRSSFNDSTGNLSRAWRHCQHSSL